MTHTILNNTNSVANHFLAELRDKDIQKDSLRFRRNLERLGEVMAYEISKTLPYDNKKIVSPLGNKNIKLLEEYPVLITVLRAGIPFFEGFLSIFDRSVTGFFGASRIEQKAKKEIEIDLSYIALPETKDKTIILMDPMLATGRSLKKCIDNINENGRPARMIIATIIASPEGINYLQSQVMGNHIDLWIGAVDDHLNQQSFIIPGLGDAGDLSFGPRKR